MEITDEMIRLARILDQQYVAEREAKALAARKKLVRKKVVPLDQFRKWRKGK